MLMVTYNGILDKYEVCEWVCGRRIVYKQVDDYGLALKYVKNNEITRLAEDVEE